jgi:hypothetical protein
MAAFGWLDRRDPDHALGHAKEDLLTYFDELPAPIKDALNVAPLNICSWCAQIWVSQYGVAEATRLIGSARFVDAALAATVRVTR